MAAASVVVALWTTTLSAQQPPAIVRDDAREVVKRQVAIRQLEVARRVGNIQPANGNADEDAANNVGVFVRDSAVAGEKLALAERMERLGEWDTSAEVYQEVLDQYADRVLPIHSDPQGRPDRFGSVTSVVQGRIARWPEAGRAVYLSRYELPARRMLESASTSNRADLIKVVNRYFITAAGRDAAVILIESYFDHAEFIAAAMMCDRLLDQHPQVDEQRPLLLTRSALSWHLAGEDVRAKERAAQLKDKHADATDTIGGKQRNLCDIVTTTLAAPRHTLGARADAGWRMPFGSNDHAALANEPIDTATPRTWARLESIALNPTRLTASPNEVEGGGPMLQRQRDLGAMTGIMPSVDGQQLYFQDNVNLYAYDLDRGEPLMGWLASYPGQGAYKFDGVASPRSVQMTTTLTERYVLAIMGQPDMASMTGGPVGTTSVVCLDRSNGRPVWKVSLSDLQSDDETLRAARPCGSVLVAGDAAYVVARSRRSGAFEDSYLCCFALESGSLRWSRHLASGNSSRMFNDYSIPVQVAGDSHLAYSDGRVFISTDMGALACVDAADGSLSWLSVYPRPLPMSPQNQWAAINMMQGAKVKPAFTGNPVIIHNGMVISMPADAEHLFIHDSVTGELQARILLTSRPSGSGVSVEQPQKFNVLVGIDGEHAVLAGSRSIAIVDLARAKGECEFNDVLIRLREFRKQGFEDDTIRGRPFLTSSSIYVPTAWKLYRLSADAQRALEMYPAAQDTWESRLDEEPGNVLFVNDSLILASPQHVNVYADLSLLRKRMEAAVLADARSITPRLRYADALFNAGQSDESIRWIDSALEQLTSNGLVTPGPDRDRVFDMAMQMFRRLSRQEKTETVLKTVLERVARTADTPLQQVSYQLARASLANRAAEGVTAVDAYQALLDDPTMSSIRIRSDDRSMSIRELSINAIDEIIKTNGRDVYQSVELRAQAALDAARAGNEPQKLFGVLDAFPNSLAGREAGSLAIAATMSSQSPSRELLRRIGSALTDPAQKTQLMESLMRSDLADGRIESALGRARRIEKLDPTRTFSVLPAFRGQTIAAAHPAELVAVLQRLVFEEQDRRLCDLNVPDVEPIFDVAKPIESPKVVSILIPSNPRRDRVVGVGSDDRPIKIFEPGNPVPIRTIAVSNVPDHATTLWRGDTLLVSTTTRVAALDTAAGSLQWTFDPQDLKPISLPQAALMSLDDQGLLDPTPRPSRRASVQDLSMQRGEVVVIQRNRQRVIRRLDNSGEQPMDWGADERNQRTRENVAFTRVAGDAIVIGTSRGRIIGLDLKSGQVKWQSNFGDRAPSMIAVYDDVIVVGGNDETSSSLMAYRAGDGAQLLNQTYSGAIQRRLNTISVSAEGYLAAIHGDSIEMFDLASGDYTPLASTDAQGQMLFSFTRSQEQAQFCGDKLLVMIGAAGTPQQVRMYDVLTLESNTVTDAVTKQRVDRQFTPSFPDGLRQNEPSARMYIHKDRLLLRGGRGFVVYSVLTADASTWTRMLDSSKTTMNSQSPILVRDGILIVNWPVDSLMMTAPAANIEYYKRQTLGDGREISTVLAEFTLKRPNARILDRVQVVDGGFYTVWSDGVLSFIPAVKHAN